MVLEVMNAPPNTQAAALDVDSAFRCCPIRPSQQPHFVIQWQGLCYIDHAAPFGAVSSGGVFGRIADATKAILQHHGIGPCKKWVDDFVFIRKPVIPPSNGSISYHYSLEDIYAITDPLGWPWKHSKTHDFNDEFKYLGFIWSFDRKTITIPPDKCSRYLTKLSRWNTGQTFTQKDAESLLGTLVHCTLALPDGRSRLPALSRFASSFNYLPQANPFTRRSPSKLVFDDIIWWREQLSRETCSSILHSPPPPLKTELWIDASTGWELELFSETNGMMEIS